jgi:hypothetical protein
LQEQYNFNHIDEILSFTVDGCGCGNVHSSRRRDRGAETPAAVPGTSTATSGPPIIPTNGKIPANVNHGSTHQNLARKPTLTAHIYTGAIPASAATAKAKIEAAAVC